MSYSPISLVSNYFKNIVSYGKDEDTISKEILKGFDINNSMQIHKFGQYINYKSDSVHDLSQTMQKIDYTLFEGTGDCEDFTRAYVKLLKNLNIPVYYWLMFTDTNYTNGHAIPIFLNEDGYLTALNYTEYYIVNSIKLDKKDFEEKSEHFLTAMHILHGAVIQNFEIYKINWLIETDKNENPRYLYDLEYNPLHTGFIKKSYIHDRTLVLHYVAKMNLSRNIILTDFLFPLLGFTAFTALWKWLK